MRERGSARVGVGLGVVGALALAIGLVAPVAAEADYAPSGSDVVGVGGDTPQYALDFSANGDTAGDSGFNAIGNLYHLVNFDATADANARQAYADGSTLAAQVPLNPTVVLRAGLNPVQRPQSSGAAITALLADTSSHEKINYVASSSLPTAANQSQASTNGWGYLHVVQLGTSTQGIAVDSAATNAPAGLSALELAKIYNGTYTKWNQLPGNSSGSSDTIIPELPPSSSSITKTFLADLKAALGSTVTLGANVVSVEQNDPSAITGAGTPADAIVPFSQARLALWTSGYFYNPATVFPGSPTPLVPGISILSGTAPDASASYSSALGFYVIYRQKDASDTAWQPGSTINWVQTLFSGPDAFFASGEGAALVAAAGVTPAYNDLGDVSSG